MREAQPIHRPIEARRRSNGSRALFLLAATTALGWPLLGPPVPLAAAEASPALAVVGVVDDPAPVALKPSGTGRTGQLTFVLRNDSAYSGPLIFEFLYGEKGQVARAGTTLAPTSAAPVAMTLNGGAADIPAPSYAASPVTLTFGAVNDASLKSVDGTLVIRGDGAFPVQPATLRLKLADADASFPWPGVTSDPAKVSLNVVRWLPTPFHSLWDGGAWGTRTTLVLRAADGSRLRSGASDVLARGQLMSDRGDTLGLVVDGLVTAGSASGDATVTLRSASAPPAGKYDGTLTLNPLAKTPKTIPVTVTSQDFILWPLLALLAGALIAWKGFVKPREEERPKQLLRMALETAAQHYRAARAELEPTIPAAAWPFDLSYLFPAGTDAKQRWQCPNEPAKSSHDARKASGQAADPDAPTPNALTVYCQIDCASQEQLVLLTNEVRDVSGIVKLWPKTCRAAKALEDACAQLPIASSAPSAPQAAPAPQPPRPQAAVVPPAAVRPPVAQDDAASLAADVPPAPNGAGHQNADADALLSRLHQDVQAMDSGDKLPIVAASEALLGLPDHTAKKPNSASEAQYLFDHINRQSDAAKLWGQIWQLLSPAQQLYGQLAAAPHQGWLDDDLEALHQSEPWALARAYLLPATSLDDLTQQDVLGRLRAALRTLYALSDIYMRPRVGPWVTAVGAKGVAAHTIAHAAKELVAEELVAAEGQVRPTVLGLAQEAPLGTTPPAEPAETVPMPAPGPAFELRRATTIHHVYESPEAILASVRRQDWWDFSGTLVLTATAFAFTTYFDKEFGSIWQYLAAFVAGAAGTLAINWKLLPWYRSYDALAGTATTSATSAGTGAK